MKEYLKAKYDFDAKDIVNTYDELSLWAAPFGLKLLEKIDYSPRNSTILDIGCGVGFPSLEIAQRFGANSTVYGIDQWTAALAQAEYKAGVYGVKNIKWIAGDAKELPFDSESFDLIVSNNGINNTGDEQQTLHECYRVCKTGGCLVFTANLPETMREFYAIFKAVLAETGSEEKINLVNDHIHQYRKSVEEYEAFVLNAGFKIVEKDVDQFGMRFCDGSAMLNYHFIKMCFLQPWQGIVGQENAETVFQCLETKLNEYAELNRGLKLSIPFVSMVCEK